MRESLNFKDKSFAVYGLGITGNSVVNFLRKNRADKIHTWDDYLIKSNLYIKNRFISGLNTSDYIVMSPGINILKSKFKKILLKNKHKIITDLDLFYLLNPNAKSIVITGTNGKSTTCKIVHHVLKKNKIKVNLGGNIGSPILNIKLKKNSLTVIEASSFQLAYSKYIKPDYAFILNITKDHLDWHGSMKHYINSKFKIFALQKKTDYAFINNKKLLRRFRKYKYKSKLKFVTSNHYNKIKKKIKNNYLNSEVNQENMNFVYSLSKILKIKDKLFIKSLESFRGLKHRYEIFYRKYDKAFINDSKATSFEASKYALKNNKNIFWIVGGLPKKGDKIKLLNIKKNIFKAYIIGKYTKYFKKHLQGQVNYKLSYTLKNATISIFKDLRNIEDKKTTILLSPASASYDQFRNFEERGNKFKKLVITYARKYF